MVERDTLIRMVTGLQQGDQLAATEVYDTFYDDTYYFIKSTVIDPELAADLTQDTFVTVLEKIQTLQEPAAFVSWLRRIAYHKAMNHFQKHDAITVEEDEDGYSVFDTLEEEREEFIPDKALDQEDFKTTILRMLLELPETQRSAMVLHYYEERPVKEIAEIQGVSEGTVKSRLNYGRNAVKQAVENYEKKNGVKLHSVGILPLLMWLFGQGVLVKDTTLATAGAGVAATAGASAVSGGAAAGSQVVTGAAVTGAKTIAGSLAVKITAVVAAAAVVVTGAVIALSPEDKSANKNPASHQTQEENEEQDQNGDESTSPVETIDPEILLQNQIHWDEEFRSTHLPNVVGIYFVDKDIPEGVETMDISEQQNGNVVMWKEETHEYDDLGLSDEPLYNMYITTTNEYPIVAPEDCRAMFVSEFSTTYYPIESMIQHFDFSNFNTSMVENMAYMFANCPYIETLNISMFDTSNVRKMQYMFSDCSSLESIDVSKFNTENVRDMYRMFYNCYTLKSLDLSSFDTLKVEDMSGMFMCCSSLQTVDLSSFDTSNVEDMSSMFLQCYSLISVDVSSFNTSNVVNMNSLFANCESLENLDVSSFDTSNVEDMGYMFHDCAIINTLDVSSFDTSKVTNMCNMFAFCTSLEQIDLSNFDTSNVTNMCKMFWISAFTSLDLSSFDTSKVTDMSEMFSRCSNLKELDISNFDTSNAIDMSEMFSFCYNLNNLDISFLVLPEGYTRDYLF